VDNITGSATLTPQDILNYATQNLTGSNSIGARLKNIATVHTTAATIAAFKGK
jgi:predicted choloylglycine hydrolase